MEDDYYYIAVIKLAVIKTNRKNVLSLFNDEGQVGVIELNNLGMANLKEIMEAIDGVDRHLLKGEDVSDKIKLKPGEYLEDKEVKVSKEKLDKAYKDIEHLLK